MLSGRRVTFDIAVAFVLRARSSNIRQFPSVDHVCAVLDIAANHHHLPALAAHVDQLLRLRLVEAEPALEVDFEGLLMAANLEERMREVRIGALPLHVDIHVPPRHGHTLEA